MQISQPRHQGGFLSGRLTVHGMLLGDDRSAKGKCYQDAYHELHSGSPQLSCGPVDFQRFYTRKRWELRDCGSWIWLFAEYFTQQCSGLGGGVFANLALFL